VATTSAFICVYPCSLRFIIGYDTAGNLLEIAYNIMDITLKPGKGGIFTRQRDLLDALDRASADYIVTCAMAANKMPLEILGEMVHTHIIQHAMGR
jgi:hypothetical protein